MTASILVRKQFKPILRYYPSLEGLSKTCQDCQPLCWESYLRSPEYEAGLLITQSQFRCYSPLQL